MQLLNVFFFLFIFGMKFIILLISFSILPGATTLEFRLIPTPAETESARSSKKRKIIIDKKTVLSDKYVIVNIENIICLSLMILLVQHLIFCLNTNMQLVPFFLIKNCTVLISKDLGLIMQGINLVENNFFINILGQFFNFCFFSFH